MVQSSKYYVAVWGYFHETTLSLSNYKVSYLQCLDNYQVYARNERFGSSHHVILACFAVDHIFTLYTPSELTCSQMSLLVLKETLKQLMNGHENTTAVLDVCFHKSLKRVRINL